MWLEHDAWIDNFTCICGRHIMHTTQNVPFINFFLNIFEMAKEFLLLDGVSIDLLEQDSEC